MTNSVAVGYSGRPLVAKLGFKPGWIVRAVNAPPHYADLMAEAVDIVFDPGARDADAAHLFLHGPELLAEAAASQIAHLRLGGMLWLSWAKKSSPRHAGITEDLLRAEVLPLGWVDVKVCAIDADWSGLKFLRRRG
ncbi:hypothetical protein KBY28_16500 [Ruegeria pomeroyi]|uniref:hypothetical protein n=1 Tax=Ruegeria pomeroyi TaxID=89184 RepID=UPI001F1F0AAD|nr:hypothetical protein [Ruegeria pomeroyi]MCE8510053.1 hypothetical protein [Ruegeria pomeroyi]